MSKPQPQSARGGGDRPLLQADAAESRRRILGAAATLAGDRQATMAEIAAAAGVGRSTLYRLFPSRRVLSNALRDSGPEAERSSGADSPLALGQGVPLPFQVPGQLGCNQP